MKERDCANCKHHTEDGCSSWDCEYEPKDLISRTDAIEAVIAQRHKVELSEYNFALGLAADAIRNLQSADAVSREECDECKTDKEGVLLQQLAELQSDYETMKNAYEDALADAEWIPCSERLPSDDEIVNITWVNHNPPPYYADIAEKPFVASGLRYCDKWYWYSSVCQDLHQDFDLIDKDIEVVAWMPLPKPYKGGDDE